MTAQPPCPGVGFPPKQVVFYYLIDAASGKGICPHCSREVSFVKNAMAHHVSGLSSAGRVFSRKRLAQTVKECEARLANLSEERHPTRILLHLWFRDYGGSTAFDKLKEE